MRMIVRSWQLRHEALGPLEENFLCDPSVVTHFDQRTWWRANYPLTLQTFGFEDDSWWTEVSSCIKTCYHSCSLCFFTGRHLIAWLTSFPCNMPLNKMLLQATFVAIPQMTWNVTNKNEIYVYDNIEANWITISELNIFGKNAQIWTFSSLLGEPKILTYEDELLKSFR